MERILVCGEMKNLLNGLEKLNKRCQGGATKCEKQKQCCGGVVCEHKNAIKNLFIFHFYF